MASAEEQKVETEKGTKKKSEKASMRVSCDPYS